MCYRHTKIPQTYLLLKFITRFKSDPTFVPKIELSHLTANNSIYLTEES